LAIADTTARPGRLALFIYDFSGGGAQRCTLTLANAFAARGYEVDMVVVRARGPLLPELSPRVRLVAFDRQWRSLPWPALEKMPKAMSLVALATYLRTERPEIVLSAASHVNRAALWARLLTRVRTRLVIRISNHPTRSAVDTRGRRQRLRLWQARYLYPKADAIVANSDGVADDVARITGLPRTRIETIYNPVGTPELREKLGAPLNHPWFAPNAPPVVLGVGKFKSQKDFPTLLKAFARVRAARPARLVILGEGRQRTGLEALARSLDVSADVALPGFVSNPYPYMKRAALFVLSSAWEGLPGVLVEALTCGCPVVSTDCPSGPAEVLDGGTYGALVPVGDDRALADAILAGLQAPPDRERLRARAALFDSEHAVDRYLEVLWGHSAHPESEANRAR
jgi:glycosyltransferase involved in cell wall biosynthesis